MHDSTITLYEIYMVDGGFHMWFEMRAIADGVVEAYAKQYRLVEVAHDAVPQTIKRYARPNTAAGERIALIYKEIAFDSAADAVEHITYHHRGF